MQTLRKHPFAAVALAASLLFGAAACGSDSDGASDGGSDTTEAPSGAITSLEDLAGKRIGVQSDTTGQAYAEENKPEGAEVVEFSDTDGLFGALESGDIDAVLQDLPVNADRAAQDDSLAVVETFPTEEEYGFAVETDSDLKAELDDALETVRENGTYDLLYEKYFPVDGAEPGPGPDASDAKGTKTITVCSDMPYAPMEFEGEGPRGLQYTGFDIELMDAMAVELDANLEVIDSDFDGILGNLSAGTCDVVASSLTITADREEQADFTEPYFDADQSLLVKAG